MICRFFSILNTKKIFWKGVKEELNGFKRGTYAKDLQMEQYMYKDERNGRDDTYLGLYKGPMEKEV